jgi:DHA1 family bicyclomycin/chloramphenicol resistance-like MFS transporter
VTADANVPAEDLRVEARTTRIPARMILIVGGLSIFGPLCLDMYLPALPSISQKLHASASAVQFSLTTCLIGIAVGQIIVGSISDRLGRRVPLVFGLSAFILASLACAAAPNIYVLTLLRFVEGFGGAAGIVISRAVVRDMYNGTTAARFFSLLMLVTGAGPFLAPQIGAGLMHIGSWRIIFLALGVVGAVLLVVAIVRLPETLPAERRRAAGLGSTVRTMGLVLKDRNFTANALATGLGFGAIFSYISGSSFVLENVFGLSPQAFSWVFALNAIGLIGGGQINARLVRRYGSVRLLSAGLALLAIGGVGLLLVAISGRFGLIGVLPCLFVALSANGFIGPNATALALSDFPHAAGSASALLGTVQFGIGAAAAPLVGLGGSHDLMPLAISMAAFGVTAIVVRLLLIRPSRAVRRATDDEPAGIAAEAAAAAQPI